MNQVVRQYNQPGKWDLDISFEKIGEEKEVRVYLDGRKQGLYELDLVSHHKVHETKGKMIVRAVVGAGAKVKIKGLIKIDKDAQQTTDYLDIKVLMLDDTAIAEVIPELEIDANEVIASHGASIGKIDEEQVKYLMSKGISRKMSESMIISGFLDLVEN